MNPVTPLTAACVCPYAQRPRSSVTAWATREDRYVLLSWCLARGLHVVMLSEGVVKDGAGLPDSEADQASILLS